MTTHDVSVGARVRLSKYGRAQQLWGPHSDAEATIRETRLINNGLDRICVRVTVDGERRARIRTMDLDYLDVVQ